MDDFSTFISTSPNAKTALTQNKECFVHYLDDLIVASYNFSQAIDEQTDDMGYLNFFNFSRVPKSLNELTAAHNGLRSCIVAQINGIPHGSSTKGLAHIAEKIRETSKAQVTLAAVADPVHGITGLVAGAASFLFDIAANYARFSTSLYKFYNAIKSLGESSFGDLIDAVNNLAETMHIISVAFYRLFELT